MTHAFASRRLVLFAVAAASLGGACSSASVPSLRGSGPTILILSVPALPDSAIAFTRNALAEAKGTVPSIQWNQDDALLATRYRKNSRGAGTSEITIAAAVSRRATPGPDPADARTGATTRVQLQAWAMDSIPQRAVIGGTGISTETSMRRPKPISRADSTDWAPVQRVLDAMLLDGAQLVSTTTLGLPKVPR
jgi:hypothetical protein